MKRCLSVAVALLLSLSGGLLAQPATTKPGAKEIVLFNGTDLTGWKHAGPGSFQVKDGELETVDGMGLLWHTHEMPEHYTLSLEFKTGRKEDNSGVFVRFPDPGNDPWVAVKEGYELQICEGNEKQFTGTVYNLKPRAEGVAAKPPGEWNLYEIDVDGQKMTVRLNGQKANEYTGERKTARGFIGLQNHDPKSKVSFRNIKVIERPAAAAAAAATTQASVAEPKPIDKARVPGLVGRYYSDASGFVESAATTKPFYSRVDDRLNFRSAKGQFYKTKLATHFAATWSGYLRIDKPGEVTLSLRSDDGSRLSIGDKLVLDNSKPGIDQVMKDKTATVTLAAGDYPIRVDYYNLGGPGGIQLAWKNGEGKFPAIPEGRFYHDSGQEKVEFDRVAWDKAKFSHKKWAEKYGEIYDKMDYGPFLSHTVEIDENNAALKGITIHLGDKDEASILFDTDLLRFAAGWTGGFLEMTGVVFDGAHGVNPAPDGQMMFTAPQLPGAACGFADDKLTKDPRPKPYGPLPRDRAKYKGLYVHGDRVVLHYTVGDVDVLDAPWATTDGDQVIITRSIKLSASDQPLTMLLDKPDASRQISVGMSKDVKLTETNGVRYLTFPPRKEPTTYRLWFERNGGKVSTAHHAPSDDIDALIKPGPARWTQPVVTKGEVSKATTQPYVLDTLTVPEDNPWRSWMRFGGLDFFSDGRAAVSTWSGDVWIVSGIDDKLEKLTWKRYATGLFQSLGLKIVDDTVYVLGRDQITRLKDTNNDGEADEYECFNNDCQVSKSFHEFAFDLQADPQGNFYFVKAGPVRPGGRGWQEITDHNGCMFKISKDGSKFEVFATGLRAPNGMGVGPNGEITCGDNEGTWTPACRLSMVHQGDFLGVVDLSKKDTPPATYEKPICFLPHGDVDNSSGGQVWVTSDNWGPFENRLLHTSYGTCSLFLVMYEQVEGQIQGGVVKFPQLDFVTGICRPRFNPKDKQLYIAGLRGWQTTAAKDAGLQRVRYTGGKVAMPSEFHVTGTGLAITFTTELDPSIATDAGNYAVEQWNLKWSSDYGSAEYSVADPKEKAHDPVEVEKVTLSPDRKTVTLKLDEVAPVMQMKVLMKLKSADGAPMNFSVYNTINKVPKSSAVPKSPATTTAARD